MNLIAIEADTISKILEYSQKFNIINICISPKINKKLLIQNLTNANYVYINFLDKTKADLANNMPVIFCIKHNYPLVLDNIQEAPSLLLTIKEIILKQNTKYKFIIFSNKQNWETINILFSDLNKNYLSLV